MLQSLMVRPRVVYRQRPPAASRSPWTSSQSPSSGRGDVHRLGLRVERHGVPAVVEREVPHLAPVVEQGTAESAGVLEFKLCARPPGEGIGRQLRRQRGHAVVLPIREGQLPPAAADGLQPQRGGEGEAERRPAHNERGANVYPRLGIGHLKMQVHFSPSFRPGTRNPRSTCSCTPAPRSRRSPAGAYRAARPWCTSGR